MLSTLLDALRNLFSWSCLDVFQDEPSLSEYALDGLRQVMAVKSRVVLPFLVPQVSPHKNILPWRFLSDATCPNWFQVRVFARNRAYTQ